MPTENQFFKVNVKKVKEGHFYGWSKAELLVWMVLKAHEDYYSHDAFPGYKTIRKLTGLSPNQISTALNKLEENNIIERTSGRDTKTVNYYTIIDIDE